MFVITEKAPTRDFSWFKATTITFLSHIIYFSVIWNLRKLSFKPRFKLYIQETSGRARSREPPSKCQHLYSSGAGVARAGLGWRGLGKVDSLHRAEAHYSRHCGNTAITTSAPQQTRGLKQRNQLIPHWARVMPASASSRGAAAAETVYNGVGTEQP